MPVKRILGIIVAILVIGFLVIQFIPFGKNHNNPSVKAEPAWDSTQTRELFNRTCGDCHSNETAWPWYTNIAPVSWLVQKDVDKGRAVFNVSEWGRREMEGDDAAEVIAEGEMPPSIFLVLHPEARLNQTDKQNLIKGLTATFGGEGEEEEGRN